MTECAPYRKPEDAVGPEELLGEFSVAVLSVISSSRKHVHEIDKDLEKQLQREQGSYEEDDTEADIKNYLDDGTDEDVERAIDNLIERSQKLYGCIKPYTNEEALANFGHDLKTRTDTMEKVMEDVARSKLLLSKMIYRYGLAIQIKLDSEKLLTTEMKLELKELDEKVQGLIER